MKKILVLLIMCFVMSLAGCGERESVETPKPDTTPITENTDENTEPPATSSLELAPQLKENMQAVLDQIGISYDAIADLQEAEAWHGGTTYQFSYKDLQWYVFCNVDDTVEVVTVGKDIAVFSQDLGAYHIDDYIPDPDIKSQVESIAYDLLRGEFKAPEGEELPVVDWYADRTNNRYNVIGNIWVQTEAGEEEVWEFALSFEILKETNEIKLRYFTIGETLLLDALDQVSVPDRKPAVEQVKTEIHVGENGFLLVDGELGEYGKEIEDTDGQKYIDYHVPVGKYLVTSKVPGCVVYVDDNEYYINDNGHIECKNISMTEFAAMDEQHEISVGENQHIILSYYATVVLEPIQ